MSAQLFHDEMVSRNEIYNILLHIYAYACVTTFVYYIGKRIKRNTYIAVGFGVCYIICINIMIIFDYIRSYAEVQLISIE